MSAIPKAIEIDALSEPLARPNVYMAVLLALGLSHLFNDAT